MLYVDGSGKRDGTFLGPTNILSFWFGEGYKKVHNPRNRSLLDIKRETV